MQITEAYFEKNKYLCNQRTGINSGVGSFVPKLSQSNY